VLAAGGLARRQTDTQPTVTLATGWAVANCTGPITASTLFRSYAGPIPQAEASVIAMMAPGSEFVTYADQTTGIAYANPSGSAATVTFTARNGSGPVAGTANIVLQPGAHSQSNLGPLLGAGYFPGFRGNQFFNPDSQLVAQFRSSTEFLFATAGRWGVISGLRSLAL